ncbi:telomere capping, CST complex subunit-domain-containing protein [Triangularia setosa]|uniref:Telomere capping, CST complex subunit-domain-containing protein n=1 Tax=Triangularia setosa TaxID=2587417 RepID=A0AAN6W979_9PEZI|nr:telomere capping, CST complex subunit-domain-containing protein [Podospora setosa]
MIVFQFMTPLDSISSQFFRVVKLTLVTSVTSYSTESGVLTLQYRGCEDSQLSFALIDVNLVLQSLGGEQTRIGEWVNVIGYVTSTDSRKLDDTNPVVEVQATLLWSAGPLNLQKYEASVKVLDWEKS